MPPPADPLQLLTTAEVAALMRMSTGWVTKQRKSGALPHVPVGRTVRFRRSAVEALQAQLADFGQPEPELAQVIHLRPVA